MQQTILITGGAGYIGSHTAFLYAQQGYHVVIIDSLHYGQTFDHPWATFIHGDIGNAELLASLFETYNFSAVLHFAAFIEVGDSVRNPLSYYQNNVVKTIRLLEMMIAYDVKRFIFSSSCAVYGVPERLPITEEHTKKPISPYGSSKLMIEMMLEHMRAAYDLEYVALRYFNAAGALPQEGLGEMHEPETHLIPNIINAAYEGKAVTIFGSDLTTPDGSCVRDYLHVLDIAQAHVQALLYLQNNGTSNFFNLGTGKGISVNEMVSAVETIIGTSIKKIYAQGRAGDPSALIADATKARTLLEWAPHHSAIETIVKSAYEFSLFKKSISHATRAHNKQL